MIINSNLVFSRQLYHQNGCPQTCPILSETPIFENFQLWQWLLQAPWNAAISYQANITKHMAVNMDDSTGDGGWQWSMVQSCIWAWPKVGCMKGPPARNSWYLVWDCFQGIMCWILRWCLEATSPHINPWIEKTLMHTRNLQCIVLLWQNGRH